MNPACPDLGGLKLKHQSLIIPEMDRIGKNIDSTNKKIQILKTFQTFFAHSLVYNIVYNK